MVIKVDPKQYVAKGTGLHAMIGWLLLIFSGLICILITSGIALIAWLVLLLVQHFMTKRSEAALRGSALRIDQDQMPWLYQATKEMADRLDMDHCPDVFITESNVQNAAAFKHGKKNTILLTDDIVYGMQSRGNEKALQFIVAHEMAHHALGHTGYFRSTIRNFYKKLSRLDEFSCDAVAHALVEDLDASKDAIIVLLVGPQLFDRVNKESLERQARSVGTDRYAKKAERHMTHPLLLRRYQELVDRFSGS
ncbi:MAG: M48 family metallopeptidase [Pirellula sp.]